jgi:muramoyltetrapeptide carboxypeptidase LdcA involved in peptidoglycan recycling
MNHLRIHLESGCMGQNRRRRTMQKNSGYEVLQGSGVVQGHLIGGCIEVLEFAKGTELWPENCEKRTFTILESGVE